MLDYRKAIRNSNGGKRPGRLMILVNKRGKVLYIRDKMPPKVKRIREDDKK